MNHRTRRRVFSFFVIFLVVCGCSSQEVASDNPDALFKEAEEELADGRYMMAIEKLRDLKNKFPYSTRAVDAELKIADAYFQQEAFIEAETAYEVFKELHPTHPRIDYVQYQVALSNFHQIPSHPGRDLTAAYKAIDAFRKLEEQFPSSEYVDKGRVHSGEARRKIAEYESYVADFYFRRRHFLSASYRYAALLKDFPDMGYDETALFRLGESYFRIRMYGNAKDTLGRLLKQFPESSHKTEALALMEELRKNN